MSDQKARRICMWVWPFHCGSLHARLSTVGHIPAGSSYIAEKNKFSVLPLSLECRVAGLCACNSTCLPRRSCPQPPVCIKCSCLTRQESTLDSRKFVIYGKRLISSCSIYYSINSCAHITNKVMVACNRENPDHTCIHGPISRKQITATRNLN